MPILLSGDCKFISCLWPTRDWVHWIVFKWILMALWELKKNLLLGVAYVYKWIWSYWVLQHSIAIRAWQHFLQICHMFLQGTCRPLVVGGGRMEGFALNVSLTDRLSYWLLFWGVDSAENGPSIFNIYMTLSIQRALDSSWKPQLFIYQTCKFLILVRWYS